MIVSQPDDRLVSASADANETEAQSGAAMVRPVDEILPVGKMLLFGLQHVLVMAASPITTVFLLSRALHLSDALTLNLISATFLVCGLGSLLQCFGPLGFGARIGAIKKGFLADMLLVDVDTPEFTPSWDLPWELVRFGNRDQIVAVFVGGRLRLWQGWPVDWDGRALLRDAAAAAADVVSRAPIARIHPASIEHRAMNVRGRGRRD